MDDRKSVVPARRILHRAADEKAGLEALEAFEAGTWGQQDPAIAQSWRRDGSDVVPFFADPASVRRIIDTTDAVEAQNAKLRRAVRTRGQRPSRADPSPPRAAFSCPHSGDPR